MMIAKNDALNQVYNALACVRSVLDGVYGMMNALLSGNFAHAAARGPEYADFRRGDARHSQADMSRALNTAHVFQIIKKKPGSYRV